MKKITPNSLAFEWKKHVRSERNEEVILTTMHLGQLKHFISCAGDESIEVMQFALTHWYGFTLKVTSSVRVPYIPSTPEILFICQHCKVLMLFRSEMINLPTSLSLPSIFPTNLKHQGLPAKIEQKASLEQYKETLVLLAEAVKNNNNV
jgi:hypothetical protein